MFKLRFCILLLIIFLCGCTKKQEEVETIQFSTWGSASEIAILKPIIADFEKQNKKIKIELMHIPQNYFQKIHLLFASNLAPDVIFINNLNLPIYANLLEPLSIDKQNYYQQSIDALSYKNNLYAIPRDISNLVIFYNKDLFDSANIKYPKQDWNINELLTIAQKLTTKLVYGISYEEDMYYVLPYTIALNDKIYPLEELENSIGLKFYNNLVKKYKVAPSKSDVGSKTVAQMFLEGKIAMHLSGRWLVPKYTESATFNWGIINFPSPVPCDVSGWAISKQSKYKESAKKFVEFISNKENIEKMTKSGLIVPARIDVDFDDTTFKNVANNSKTINITPKYTKIMDKLNDTVFINNP